MENGLKEAHTTIASLNDLWEYLGNVWHALPPKYFHRLSESMSRHVAAILKPRGAATRY